MKSYTRSSGAIRKKVVFHSLEGVVGEEKRRRERERKKNWKERKRKDCSVPRVIIIVSKLANVNNA